MLITRHSFFSSFVRYSLFFPIYIRLIIFLVYLSVLFCLNAVLFSDDYIDERAENLQNMNYVYTNSEFLYTIVKHLFKCLISFILSLIIRLLLNYLCEPSKLVRIEVFEAIKTKNPAVISTAYNIYKKKMKRNFIIFYIISGLIFFFSWYYNLVFCNVYSQNSRVWFYGGVISFIQDFIVKIVLIILLLLLRKFILEEKKSR